MASKNKDSLKKFEKKYGTKVSTGVSSILNPPNVEEAVKSHILKGSPLDFQVETLYGTKLEDDPAYLADYLRQVLSKEIANKLSKSNIKSEDILPFKQKVNLSQLPEENIKKGVRGMYSPDTGNIQLDFNRPEEDLMATYVHELAHKTEGQSVGYEGKFGKKDLNPSVWNVPRYTLYENREDDVGPVPSFKGTPTNKKYISGKDLINYYYGKHHRADAENAWEIEALRNLEAGKPIREPMTKDLSPEYKEAIRKFSSRGKK